ncbi:MAG: DUF6454 family protein [Bauldia sp.]
MKSTLAALALATTALASVAGPALADAVTAERFQTLTRSSQWELVDTITLGFETFHPQGLVKIGDRLFLSSVEIIEPTQRYDAPQNGMDRTAGVGRGHLFELDLAGNLVNDLVLGEGDVYHPGGIDFDGTYIWVPVAEYRPNSHAIVYRVDPATMEATEMFRFADHVGGVVHNTEAQSLHGVSWGSRRFYAWPVDGDLVPTNLDVRAGGAPRPQSVALHRLSGLPLHGGRSRPLLGPRRLSHGA